MTINEQSTVKWVYEDQTEKLLNELKGKSYMIIEHTEEQWCMHFNGAPWSDAYIVFMLELAKHHYISKIKYGE